MKSTRKYQHQMGIKTEYVSLWIRESPSKIIPEKYFCSKCRCPVFEYVGDLVTEAPGGSPTKVPIVKKCPNRKCGRKYYIHTIVKTE